MLPTWHLTMNGLLSSTILKVLKPPTLVGRLSGREDVIADRIGTQSNSAAPTLFFLSDIEVFSKNCALQSSTIAL